MSNKTLNRKPIINKPKPWGWTLLFTTSATLVCCALPLLFVSLGMGSAVASIASAAPWLIKLSLYKDWVFAISGVLIVLAAWSVMRSDRVCPTDPALAQVCATTDKWNKRFILLSAALWCIGFFAAYVLMFIQN